jgi:two-component system cell cycle response regulator
MPGRVLVVDDQPLNVKLLEGKLAKEYYEVVTAYNAYDALDLMRESRPDIAVLDVMMPGMDGIDLCKLMKADPELMHVPVIMVTALSEPADRVRGLEAGADDFLTKPINDIALFARIRSLLRLKMALDELRLRDHAGSQLGLTADKEISSEDGSGAEILVVSDSAADARLVEEVLSDSHRITVVSDPQETLKISHEGKFDIIIVGIEKEETGGLRLCSLLRSDEATRQVPLLMMLDEEDTERLAKGFDIGINDYIYRPIDRNELIARTRSQVRHKRYQERLRSAYQRSVSLATTDSLTGLYNRRYLESYLASLVDGPSAGDKPLSVAMIDIDHFKPVNDTHGHDVGDDVLREVSDRLRRVIRASDLVARFGGEEFVIVMPDTDIELAETVSKRLRAEIADTPFAIDQLEAGLNVTVSIGVAAIGSPGETPVAMLKRADEALYEAKRGGRNKVIAAAG